MKRTFLEREETAYVGFNGRQVRKGRAIFPDGKIRSVRAGIPDTFFTIPAHGRIGGKYVGGYLYVGDQFGPDGTEGEWMFKPAGLSAGKGA